MNCPEYSALNVIEQYQLIGKCIHLLQNDSAAFIKISQMIKEAEKKGLFEGVKILPEGENKRTLESQ